MMEVVLTRLRDFSCKDTTFDDCSSVEQTVCRDPWSHATRPSGGPLSGGCSDRASSPYKLDIQNALAWLRRELMEMRSQDQALVRQLMDLHTGIQELKQELSEVGEEEEEEKEEEGASCWDFDSSSSVYSSSGEVGLSVSCLSARLTPPTQPGSQSRTLFSRRSSLP